MSQGIPNASALTPRAASVVGDACVRPSVEPAFAAGFLQKNELTLPQFGALQSQF